ncbi:hypothetical protein VN97_g11156 [Penicillium thymicola]|uniref:Uncharacterized protein n=1 Tax=Penicillium thymicola TaxID=293382 RepID=A0AAI9X3Q1_PENTH|nr:hypothetical protein VN97_g11156 [Penicillium thymicola]
MPKAFWKDLCNLSIGFGREESGDIDETVLDWWQKYRLWNEVTNPWWTIPGIELDIHACCVDILPNVLRMACPGRYQKLP